MNVLLLGASGRIGQRITNELLEGGHEVTGVSRSGEIDGIDDTDFKAVAGDATDPDEIAGLAESHDAVASALGPSGEEGVEILPEMAEALIEGLRQIGVDRFVWTGGAGGLNVGPDTKLVDTDEFPDELVPLAEAHIDAFEIIRDVDDLQWSYIAPPAQIEPGERTGEYRTSEGQLVASEDGESYISMEDFAIAFVDELENDDAIHTQLAVGY
ncbi:NAD(P)-dependent oxidoreductase [Natrialba taiwanensis]|uniref:NADH dehydrogenase 32K chain n=1 Tax=Natrialba taiwanensis DSM 12281 TaxID=1230458 RepID=L9ZKD8_9EURY|nr:NAD(P)H-binding protein [Natrialba taiwanensis]ELY86491.1 NADH dehydrogenase 32K chain [Natrialba taiwanensis DSM 12281]